MTRLIPSSRRVGRRLAVALLASLVPGMAVAAPQEAVRNLVGDGDFEGAGVTLRLPAVSPFPLVAGGWGARGGGPGQIEAVDDAATGLHSLQLASAPDAPAHLIQDVPVGTSSFVLELSVRRLRGRQHLRLLSAWDRLDPDTQGSDVELTFSGAGVRLRTGAGTWNVEWPAAAAPWVDLRLVADARQDLLQLWLDGLLVASVPATLESPRSLLIGGHGRGPSSFRYDALGLYRLAEIELEALRERVAETVPERDLRWIEERFEAAATALSWGDERLAAPEIRAAARLLERALGEAPESSAATALIGSARALASLLGGA